MASCVWAQMAAGFTVRVAPDSQRPHIIETTPVDGSTVHTATPQLQCVFDQDMNTSRTIAWKVLLPNGLQIQTISWSDSRTLNISYTGALPDYGAKRIDLADGYFVNTSGIAIPVGGGWAFCYHPIAVQDPTIVGDIVATPPVPAAGTTTSFSVTATDPAGYPLTYTWDFGDGTTFVGGPTPSHTYSSAGPFLVTVKVDNGQGGTALKALMLAGPALPPSNVGNLEVINATVCLVFAKAHKDKIQFMGSMNLPAGFSPGGKVATVSFGGVTQTFTMSPKGLATAKGDRMESFRLYYQLTTVGKGAGNRKFIGGPVKFKVSLYGWFAQTLAPLGFTNATTPKLPPPTVLSVPVTASIDGNVGQVTSPIVWKSKVNASGIGSQRTVVH